MAEAGQVRGRIEAVAGRDPVAARERDAGVAHATRKCALVRNISQAWGSNPPAWSIFTGWGTPPRQRRIRGLSLRSRQWPSCLTTPATSLSYPRPSSRRSPWPSRRAPTHPSGRTSHIGEPHQPPVARRDARGHQHGAVDSDVQASPRHLGEMRPSILLLRFQPLQTGHAGGDLAGDRRSSEAEKFFGSNQQTEPAHEEQNKCIGGHKKPERGRVLGTII